MDMTLRIEVFAQDIDQAGRFYRDVLGFEELSRQPRYLWMGRGSARIGIGAAGEPIDPALRRVPAGTEIVLEVDDIDAEYERVRATGWPVEGAVQLQEWGLRDFRLFDADGYYLRLTSRSARQAAGR
ncbi:MULTISPECIES: VOC family protein [unclassified Kribbella]|uniref:VOC family protein n=1 Tax=unclassified Kribbella TaxID=2644121 RepID=UPI0030772FC5